MILAIIADSLDLPARWLALIALGSMTPKPVNLPPAPTDEPIFLAQRERIYAGMRKVGVPED